MLLNCPVASFNNGSILIKSEAYNEDVFLILTGVLEYIESKSGISYTLSVGSLIGEYSRMMSRPSKETYRAASNIKALQIPGDLFIEFAKKNNLEESIKQTHNNREFLQNTWLFGEMVSYPIQNKIAQLMTSRTYAAGKAVLLTKDPLLFMLEKGEVEIYDDKKTIDILTPGAFFGEGYIVLKQPCLNKVRATKPSVIKRIPGDLLINIPIVQWKLLETIERRKHSRVRAFPKTKPAT